MLFGLRTLAWFDWQTNPELDVASFSPGPHPGWQLAIALALALPGVGACSSKAPRSASNDVSAPSAEPSLGHGPATPSQEAAASEPVSSEDAGSCSIPDSCPNESCDDIPQCPACGDGVCTSGCVTPWIINCCTYEEGGIDGGFGLAMTDSCDLCVCPYVA